MSSVEEKKKGKGGLFWGNLISSQMHYGRRTQTQYAVLVLTATVTGSLRAGECGCIC